MNRAEKNDADLVDYKLKERRSRDSRKNASPYSSKSTATTTSSSSSSRYVRSRSTSLTSSTFNKTDRLKSRLSISKCSNCVIWQNIYQIFEFLVNGRLLVNEHDYNELNSGSNNLQESIAINLNDAARINTSNKYDYLFNLLNKLKFIKNPIDPSESSSWQWDYKSSKHYKLLKLKLKLLNQITQLAKLFNINLSNMSCVKSDTTDQCKYCLSMVKDKRLIELKNLTITRLNDYVTHWKSDLERFYDRYIQVRLKNSFDINNLNDLNSYIRQSYQPTWLNQSSNQASSSSSDALNSSENLKKAEYCSHKIHILLDLLVSNNSSPVKSDQADSYSYPAPTVSSTLKYRLSKESASYPAKNDSVRPSMVSSFSTDFKEEKLIRSRLPSLCLSSSSSSRSAPYQYSYIGYNPRTYGRYFESSSKSSSYYSSRDNYNDKNTLSTSSSTMSSSSSSSGYFKRNVDTSSSYSSGLSKSHRNENDYEASDAQISPYRRYQANPYHHHMDVYSYDPSFANTNNNNNNSKYERTSYQREANTDALQLYASNSSTSSLSSYSSPMLLPIDNPGSPEPSNSSSTESKPAKAKLNSKEKKKSKESKKASHSKKSKPNKISKNKDSEEKKEKKDEKRKSQKIKTPNSSDFSLNHSKTYENENSSSTTQFNAKIRSRSLSPFENKLADISTFSNIETNENSAKPSKKRKTSEHNKKDRASSASSASSSSNKRFKGAENIDSYLIDNGSNLLSLMTEIKKNNVTDKQKRKQNEKSKAKSKKSTHHHKDEKVKKETKKEANSVKATNESSDTESSKILTDEINDPASILVLVDFDLSSASKQTSCQLCNQSQCGEEMDELCAILPIIQYKLTNENFGEYWNEFLIKYDLVNEYDFILKRFSLMVRSSMYDFKDKLFAMMGLDENEPSLDKKEIIIEDFRTKLELMDRIAAECLERLEQQKVYLNELREFFKYDVRNLSWQTEEVEEGEDKEKEKTEEDQIRKKIYNLQFDLIEYARMIKQYQSVDLVKALSFDCLVDILDRFIQMYYYI